MSGTQGSTEDPVAYEAQLHWVVFATPVVIFIAGIVAVIFNPLAAIALLLVSIVSVVGAYWKLATTRIMVTPRRVIYRTGYIARRTVEMNKDKIESIDVNQSVLGRLFDFGSVTVKGTGGGIEAINNVAAPFELRHRVAGDGIQPAWMPGISEAKG